MYMPSKNTSKSAPKVDAKFHDGVWLRLRMESDWSINWDADWSDESRDCEGAGGSKMVRGGSVEQR